ncbi:hypothetical protein C8R43DRAFT_681746 [Mycena crocata]|nr:hypothetical protein C8R43DRAFT_681746 [Mycena crocata]
MSSIWLRILVFKSTSCAGRNFISVSDFGQQITDIYFEFNWFTIWYLHSLRCRSALLNSCFCARKYINEGASLPYKPKGLPPSSRRSNMLPSVRSSNITRAGVSIKLNDCDFRRSRFRLCSGSKIRKGFPNDLSA